MQHEDANDATESAVEIANEIHKLLRGHSVVTAVFAMGLVAGYLDTLRQESDIETIMQGIRKIAINEAARIRASRQH